MKTKTISVGFTRTYNIGNYESIKLHAGTTKEIADDDDEDLSVHYQELYDEVMAEVFSVAKDIVPDTPE